MQMEGEEEAQRLEDQFKSMVFANDLSNGLENYKVMFPLDERDTFTEEDIKEEILENEEDFQRAANEMLRMGLITGLSD